MARVHAVAVLPHDRFEIDGITYELEGSWAIPAGLGSTPGPGLVQFLCKDGTQFTFERTDIIDVTDPAAF